MTDSRSSLFYLSIKVFARLFQKAVSSTDSGGRAPQSAKSPLGVFFLRAFSFAPVYAKEKADRHKSFVLAVGCTRTLSCRGRRLDDPHSRGEHRSPAKKHKETFLLSYFCVTKSTKSHQRERSPLFENSSRVHELVARSSAWQVRATRGRAKVGSLATLYNFSYTTRANISHEIAEQIRARITCTPAESAWRTWIR